MAASAFAVMLFVCSAAATVEQDAAVDSAQGSVEVRLRLVSVLQGVQVPVELQGREMAFRKEPDFQGRDVVRGGIPTGKQGVLGFAWDKELGLLHLDLNRNLDLTDDATGVFQGEGEGENQRFADLAFSLEHNGVPVPYRIDVAFRSAERTGTHCTVAVRSGWQGEIDVNEKRFQLTVIDNLDGVIDNQDTAIIQRLKPTPGPAQRTRIQKRLQFGLRRFEYAFAFEAGEAHTDLVGVLDPWRPVLAQLQIQGESIEKLSLHGPIPVHLKNPKSTVPLPVGTYAVQSVTLEGGRQSSPDMEVVVTKAGPNVLKIGGPVKPRVEVSRSGAILRLTYGLAGIGGEPYTSPHGIRRGAFAVLRGGKKVAWDQFQRG